MHMALFLFCEVVRSLLSYVVVVVVVVVVVFRGGGGR